MTRRSTAGRRFRCGQRYLKVRAGVELVSNGDMTVDSNWDLTECQAGCAPAPTRLRAAWPCGLPAT